MYCTSTWKELEQNCLFVSTSLLNHYKWPQHKTLPLNIKHGLRIKQDKWISTQITVLLNLQTILSGNQCMEQLCTEQIDKKGNGLNNNAGHKICNANARELTCRNRSASVAENGGCISHKALGFHLPMHSGRTATAWKKCIKIEWASGSLLSNNACEPCLPLNTTNVSDWDLERFQILILSDGWSVGQCMPHDSVDMLNHSSMCCVLSITFHSEANARNKRQWLYV